MLKIQRLNRNGSSIVVTVPAPILRHLGWHRGDLVAVALEGARVVVNLVDESVLTAASKAGARRAAAARG